MKNAILVGVVFLSTFLLMPRTVSAQDQGTPAAEVSGGYVFLRDFELDANFPSGWFASGGVNLADLFAVIGEVSCSYETLELLGRDLDATVYTFMGGARFPWRMERVTPFAQVLAGVARASGVDFVGVQVSDAVTDFAIQPGGGADVRLTDRLAARFGLDYRRTTARGSGSGAAWCLALGAGDFDAAGVTGSALELTEQRARRWRCRTRPTGAGFPGAGDRAGSGCTAMRSPDA